MTARHLWTNDTSSITSYILSRDDKNVNDLKMKRGRHGGGGGGVGGEWGGGGGGGVWRRG